MLRTETTIKTTLFLWSLCAAIGMMAAALVSLGNPGNMGLCGACFLRDTAGAFGLFIGQGPRVFRPELVGLTLGAFLFVLARRSFAARSGSYAGPRFFLGVWMGIGALVFLGCPFRMLQRLGGGDLNAVVGLGGFLAGVGLGRIFETRGYTAGKTAVAPVVTATPALLIALGALALFLSGSITAAQPPLHNIWPWSLSIALAAGAALSLTGFCAVTAGRQFFNLLSGPKKMLVAALCLILGYAVISLAAGRFSLSFENQPIAHTDHLWNALSMALVGLTGVLAGGCPVRLIVLTGEGNGDAMTTTAGIVVGVCLAHGMGLASSPAGTTELGRYAVAIGLGVCTAYALAVTLTMKPTTSTAE